MVPKVIGSRRQAHGGSKGPHRGARPQLPSRREGLLWVASISLLPARIASADPNSPYKRAAEQQELGLLRGRIRTCPTNVNPNCVSTSSLNPDSYLSPWRAPESIDLVEACNQISDVMLQLAEGTALAASDLLYDDDDAGSAGASSGGGGPDGEGEGERVRARRLVGKYLLFETPGRFGQDKVEFLVKLAAEREWEGERPGLSVFYRSLAGGVKYVYPIQQPISDFGEQRKRMQHIRNDLEWRLSGCELVECYE
mmetsp:Transcript_12623/g.31950  ORF Transcript_12623/g.31950 Transcript_12623/m.31950 type:complete len:254 (-) Transcript_12623:105-866(-)